MSGDLIFQDSFPEIDKSSLGELGQTLISKASPFKQGRYGWLYDLSTYVHRDSGELRQMLKVLKPIYGIDEVSKVNEDFLREITALSRLGGTHGIPRITWSGNISVKGKEHSAFAYTKIEQSVTLASLQHRQFSNDGIALPASSQTLFDLGLRLLETLHKIHAAGIRHLDIHPSNILVSQDKSARGGQAPFDLDIWLIDFGKSAVPLDHAAQAQLSNELVEFMPRDQMQHLIRNGGRYAYREDVNVLREPRSAAWDLHAAGECFKILGRNFAFRPEEGPHREGLTRFTEILQDGTLDYEKRVASAKACALQWRNAIPRMNSIKVRTFVAAHASLDPILTPVLDSAPVQRLRRVQQLALTQLLYPGATHTRFAHTLGVVDLADRYIEKANLATPLNAIATNERLVCLAYAMVHDIGHYPFAHYIEEIDHPSLGEVGPLLHHEIVGHAMYCSDPRLPDVFNPQLRDALENTVPSFNNKTFLDYLGADNRRTHLGQIIDGPIDADKLDYLVRDGNACGISYANGIDVSRFLDSLRIYEDEGRKHLGISVKGIASASELYYTRFHMYSEVYYHKVSRFIAAAIKRALVRVLNQRRAAPDILIRELLKSSELQVVDYLTKHLADVEDGRYSPMLQDPLGQQGRKLFKRIRTYSDIWLGDALRARELSVLDALRHPSVSFRKLGDVETRISDRIDRDCVMPAGTRACVLIDVPPPKGISRFPFVVDARGPSYLNQANPLVQSAASAQRQSQRVRVFVSRDTHEGLQKRFPSRDVLDRFIDDLILEETANTSTG